MAMLKRVSLLIDNLASLFPFLLLIISISGILATIVINRLDLTINSLRLVIPMSFAASFLIFHKYKDLMPINCQQSIRFNPKPLMIIFFIIYTILCLVLIEHDSRPFSFFLLISLASGIILLQIIGSHSKIMHAIVLLEIILLSLIILWGVNLRYPLYYGWTDVLPHLHFIDTIRASASTQDLELVYQNFPLFHISILTFTEALDIPLIMGYFIFMGLVWQIGTVFSFLFFRRLSSSPNVSLVACLLFALNSQIIFYGTYSVTRSLGFVFFIILLFLLLQERTTRFRFTTLIVVTTAALILTHHLTVLYVVVLLVIMLLLKRVIMGETQLGLFDLKFVILLFLSFIIYLLVFAYDFTSSTISFLLSRLSHVSTSGAGSSILQSSDLLNPGTILSSIILGISLCGIGYLLGNGRKKPSRHEIYLAITSLILLFLYLPDLVNLIPFSDTLLLYRLSLLVTPFVALAMAYGLIGIYRDVLQRGTHRLRQSVALSIIVMIVMATTFFASISDSNALDSKILVNNNSSVYFSETDIVSFTFTSTNSEHTLPLFSDYSAIRNTYHLGRDQAKSIIQSGNVDYIKGGYILLRIGELESNGCLLFRSFGSTTNYCYELDDNSNESNIVISSFVNDLVYNNNNVRIYLASKSLI